MSLDSLVNVLTPLNWLKAVPFRSFLDGTVLVAESVFEISVSDINTC